MSDKRIEIELPGMPEDLESAPLQAVYCPHMDELVPRVSCTLCSPVPKEWRRHEPPNGVARFVSICPAGCDAPIRMGDRIVRNGPDWVHPTCHPEGI